MNTFFQAVAAYFDDRGWEKPGTQEQFAEAILACWGVDVVTDEDGVDWARIGPLAQQAMGLVPQSLN